jgi:hypothetical protein
MHWTLEQSGDNPALAVAKYRLAAVAEDFLDGLAGRRLDLLIRIKKRQIEPRGDSASNLGFAGAHQADKYDSTARQETSGNRLSCRCWHGLDLHIPPPFVAPLAAAIFRAASTA